MMRRIDDPPVSQWDELCRRPGAAADAQVVRERVAQVLDEVRRNGDAAVRAFTRQFDGVDLETSVLEVAPIEVMENVSEPGSASITAPALQLPAELRAAIRLAKANIETFHRAQADAPKPVETMPGVACWRRSIPIERVGLYIPGGSAPLFSSLLMTAVPAGIAGCAEVVVCTPPDRDGGVSPVILYTAALLGIRRIHRIGGAQAIAAMAFGTGQVPRVDKIFGPGNAYVTEAKLQAQQAGVAIDLPAGPSEVLVIADRTARPAYVAADLLSQAEHGPDSQVVLVSDDGGLIDRVIQEVKRQLETLPRAEIARQALAQSLAVLVRDLDEALRLSDRYAPEHLILAVDDARAGQLADQVRHAGSVFLGHWSCESAGDYASGTNHTLPTGGHARNTGGVSLDSFVRKVTFQRLSPEGVVGLGPSVVAMAEAEGLDAHARAVSIRLPDAREAAGGVASGRTTLAQTEARP